MARNSTDSKRLKRAHKKWLGLRESGKLSAPEGTHYGIVVSSDWDRKTENHKKKNHLEYVAEAEEQADRLRADNREVTIGIARTGQDLAKIVGNRAISDLFFIGDGTLSNFWFPGKNKSFTWWNMSRSMDHLKNGYVIQRHCGVRWSALNVALGTFAVRDMRNVLAPVGEEFLPESLDDEAANYLIGPVYGNEVESFDYLLEQGRVRDEQPQDFFEDEEWE